MWTRRAVLVGAGAAALAPPAWSQELSDISGDVAILREAYETLHPGLYRYATPEQTVRRFDALARAWSRPQSRAEAYLSLSRFLGSVQCGHTYANFYNQRRVVAEELFAGRNRLPFHFAWIDGRMVVLRNFSGDERLAPGTQVLSIDGRSTRRILASLLPLARADGGNDYKRRALLGVRGVDRFESFDIYFPLVFPMQDEAFALRVRTPGGAIRRLDLAPVDLAQRRASMAQASQAENAPAWTITYPNDRTALLDMPNWALYNSSWDWRAFLNTAFEEFQSRGITKLIVDIRANEGGLDCGEEIVARLIDRDLPLAVYERRVRYVRTPDHLNQYLDTWDDSFRNWGDDAERIDDRFFRLRASEDNANFVITPKAPRFRGEVIVLIGPTNSSATFQFANLVQSNGLARLVGGPTGGNQRGINGGGFFFLRLPASGLEADLPLIGTFPPTPRPDAGLLPDVLIEPTPADIAAGRDPVLEAALA